MCDSDLAIEVFARLIELIEEGGDINSADVLDIILSVILPPPAVREGSHWD